MCFKNDLGVTPSLYQHWRCRKLKLTTAGIESELCVFDIKVVIRATIKITLILKKLESNFRNIIIKT